MRPSKPVPSVRYSLAQYKAAEYLTLGTGLEGLMAQYKADKMRD